MELKVLTIIDIVIYNYTLKLNIIENKKALKKSALRGPTWARTRDHLIMSQVL